MVSFSVSKICHRTSESFGKYNVISLVRKGNICFSETIINLPLTFRYFFAEVFDFFRSFFLIVFHVNILFMLLPLAIRLKHRPCFLAFIYLAISSLLKSYPSVSTFNSPWTDYYLSSSEKLYSRNVKPCLGWRFSLIFEFMGIVRQWVSR